MGRYGDSISVLLVMSHAQAKPSMATLVDSSEAGLSDPLLSRGKAPSYGS
jgi:hypothetical protein